jgi:hypothetical protein
MLRWARLLISVLALVSALAGGAGGAFAVTGSHPCIEMGMDDCPDGHGHDNSALPGCAQFVCGQCQTTLPLHETFLSPMVLRLVAQSLPRNDLPLSALSGPPDLRPPIA